MIIIKIGGSLCTRADLINWLEEIVKIKNYPVIIVPGGGPFADTVRHLDNEMKLSPACSHELALMAMQQYARLMCDLNPALPLVYTFDDMKNVNSACVWAPHMLSLEYCPYPKNWETTSDSLSVWLAAALKSNHLCLVKSAQLQTNHELMINSNLVDAYFSTALGEYGGKLHFYHASQAKIFLQQFNDGHFS